MNPEYKPAVIYARYSSSSQTEQSIEGQLHDAYDFAQREGYTILREYIDRAQTGTNDNRPSFQKMIKDAERSDFQYILVWKLDRFARNRYDSAVHKHRLAQFGVRVVSVKENISDTPEGVILEGLLEAMAEYYSADLSQKIRRGRQESVRKGLFPGGPVPIGYTVENKRLVPDPRTAPVVTEIFTRYADGERIIDIVHDLNNRGFRAKRGAKFMRSTIVHILENKSYTGDYYFNGTIVRGAVDPLIDLETFERAQANKEKNRKAPAKNRTPESPCILLHKLYCGECGHKMTGACGKTKAGVQFRYYGCDGRTRFHTQCGMHVVQRKELHYAVCRIVSDLILYKNRRTLEALADSIMEVYLADLDTSELDVLETQYRQTERDLDKLVDSLITMPESVRPRIAQRMEELEAQKKDLEIKLAKKRAECSTTFSHEDFVKYLQVTFTDIESMDNQKFIIDRFVNSVYLYNDGRIVVYLNQIRGLPFLPPDDSIPGKGDVNRATPITPPPGIRKLAPFSRYSSLYTYAPTYVCKEEYSSPLLFFLHGRVGVIAWRYRLTKSDRQDPDE
jgi:DNA invertase Pin-like site-specific DNA recombinase